MDMGDRIREKRRERGYTLKYIADKMGVSEATVQRWEAGNIKNMRHGRIAKLAQLLDIEPSYLIGWDDVPVSDADRRRAELYAQAKQSDDPVLKSLVDALDRLLGLDQPENDEK